MRTQYSIKSWAGILIALGAAIPAHAELPDAVVQESFFPYKNGVPKVEGITPGMVVNKSNVEAAKSVLAPALYNVIKKGEYAIEVQETTDFAENPKFIEDTKRNSDKVSLNPDGTLKGFLNGRPFPQPPDPKDPNAGLKLAWNFQYGRVWGDLGCIQPWYWNFRNYDSGKVDRTIVWDKFCLMRISGRAVDEPTPELDPNPSQLYRAMYGRISEPVDIKDTQLLIHKYKDDKKLVDGYLYLGFQRRVRRLATGQINDSFLGSDIMLEDFEGYNGKITDMKWTYKGTQTMLLPWYDRSKAKDLGKQYTYKEADGSTFAYTSTTGQGGCYPDVPWQLRKAYVIEAKPTNPDHPIGKRVFYMDAQTNEMGVIEIFDRKGDLWKLFLIGWPLNDRGVHPINKGKGVDLGDIATVIDLQARHCTTLQFRGRVDPSLAKRELFTVQNLRGAD